MHSRYIDRCSQCKRFLIRFSVVSAFVDLNSAADGAGMGPAFLRHVQRCKVLLHVVDGSADDPIGDFITINEELKKHDPFLAKKPQVVVLNKVDITDVKEMEEDIIAELKRKAGHSRVLSISAATTENVKELMGRLKKFASTQPDADLPPLIEVDLGKASLDQDSDDFGTLHCVVQNFGFGCLQTTTNSFENFFFDETQKL